MLKFNAESILSLRDEPLKKENRTLKTSGGKENQKMNTQLNDHASITDLKESTKKKYRRTVLRREAEKSLPKDDDLLWDPSFISIASLSQVQSNASKIENPKLEINENEINPTENQGPSTKVSLDFIDEIIEICMALNKRPVRAAPIERFSRLQSRHDFNFQILAEINSQAIDSACLRLTSNLASAAQDLVAKIPITSDDQQLREINALFMSLQMLNKAFLEVGCENTNREKMIDAKLLFDLAGKCLDELKNDSKDIQTKNCYDIKCRIRNEATKLFEMTRPYNSI